MNSEPSYEEWQAYLEVAREASLALEDGDRVPHGRLIQTLKEAGLARNRAESSITEASEAGMLSKEEGPLAAAYALAESPPPTSEGDSTSLDVQSHYSRVRPVYEALGNLGDNPTLMLNDFTRWYITRDATEQSLLDLGYTKVGRPATVADYDVLVDRVERTMYAVTSYKRPSSVERETAYKWQQDKGRQWANPDRKTPTYSELVAYPMWGDIDLTKTKDSNGEVRGIREIRFDEGLDADTRETIERTIEAYISEYAAVYGSRDAIHALDSGGGIYIFGAPEATLPIAEAFADDEDALERIFKFLRQKEKEYLHEAQRRVEDRVDGAADVISPDWCNNKNRQYKAPLALHKSADVLVTPIDTSDVDFTLTRAEDLTDDLIDECVEWAESFTSTDHTASVNSLVGTLWPDEYTGVGDWEDTITSWLEDERREELRKMSSTATNPERTDSGEITSSYDEVIRRVDQLDAFRVGEKTIVQKWNDNAGTGGDNRAFWPTWGNVSSDSGTANYIDPHNSVWNDTGEGGWGTVVEMALIAANELNWRTAAPVDGSEWARGVRELSRLGFDVPVWTPDANSQQAKDGKMPLWSLRNAAVALEVLDEDGFVERESPDGGTYLGFPDAGTYNAALRAVENAGLEHGREPAGDGKATLTRKQLGLEEVADDPEERMSQLHAELEMMD